MGGFERDANYFFCSLRIAVVDVIGFRVNIVKTHYCKGESYHDSGI